MPAFGIDDRDTGPAEVVADQLGRAGGDGTHRLAGRPGRQVGPQAGGERGPHGLVIFTAVLAVAGPHDDVRLGVGKAEDGRVVDQRGQLVRPEARFDGRLDQHGAVDGCHAGHDQPGGGSGDQGRGPGLAQVLPVVPAVGADVPPRQVLERVLAEPLLGPGHPAGELLHGRHVVVSALERDRADGPADQGDSKGLAVLPPLLAAVAEPLEAAGVAAAARAPAGHASLGLGIQAGRPAVDQGDYRGDDGRRHEVRDVDRPHGGQRAGDPAAGAVGVAGGGTLVDQVAVEVVDVAGQRAAGGDGGPGGPGAQLSLFQGGRELDHPAERGPRVGRHPLIGAAGCTGHAEGDHPPRLG